MNIQVINQLLSEENVKGVKITLIQKAEIYVNEFDEKLSSANILYVTDPSTKVIDLNHAVMIEPVRKVSPKFI
ncbi:hypothetical protein ACOSZA_11500 [Mammaliicoccus sciuri]|uniref:hypothetical protein n=1 Tax=Mammaliicoccus sciuri TaxID=1296 RepID=UPI00194E7495